MIEIDRFLAGLGRSDKLKLFIFHHHPLQYLDVTFTAPDFSIMSNAAGLLDVISKYQFDFIVHGHKHIPRFKMEIKDDGHPLNILCAGSFSASLDHKYFEAVGNNFHLIDFHDRCPESKYVRGSVRTWTHFSGRGWTPSLRRAGVERQQNFGAFLPRPQLVSRLKITLEQEFNQAQFIMWPSFVDKHPEFRYFTSETVRASLKEVSETMNLVLHEIDALSLEQLVILKG